MSKTELVVSTPTIGTDGGLHRISATIRGPGIDEEIWFRSPVFQRFRGIDWMPEPCRSCDRREIDFGGCRCQAFLLTGDPAATDPVCHLSPMHAVVERALDEAQAQPPPLQFRAFAS